MTATENPSQDQIDQAARLVAGYWNRLSEKNMTCGEITAEMWWDQDQATRDAITRRAHLYTEVTMLD